MHQEVVHTQLSQNNLAPELGNYLDYRKYLLDFYLFKREQTKTALRPYTYAVFAAAADIKSPNYLKLIIEGERNLSIEMAQKFAKALGLNKERSDEFVLMVEFGQSEDPAERNLHLKKLIEHRVKGQMKSGEINRQTWEKVPNWVTWILYAMLDQKNVNFQEEELYQLLRGQAPMDEIRLAMKNLIEKGEVTRDEATGALSKSRALMESAENIPVALVRKLQAELMYLGLESLFRDSAVDREFGSATLCLTKAEFEDLRFQLRKLRKEVQKDTGVNRLSGKGDRVYQLNLQLFPVTNPAAGAKRLDN